MRSRLERELSVWIDMAMESMDEAEHHGMQLTDDEAVDAKLSNIEFRDKLVSAAIELIGEAVEYRKIAQSLKKAGIDKAYQIGIKVSSSSIEKMAPIHAT